MSDLSNIIGESDHGAASSARALVEDTARVVADRERLSPRGRRARDTARAVLSAAADHVEGIPNAYHDGTDEATVYDQALCAAAELLRGSE